MTTTLLVRDVGAFSIQLGVIVVAAGAVWRLLKVRQATVTLTFWYLVLAACLLLPICQPRLVPVAPSAADDRTPPVAAALVETAGPVTATRQPPDFSFAEVTLAVIAIGIAARALWLTLAALSLARLLRTAVHVNPVPVPIQDAQASVGASADVYISDRIAGPITFGFRRPIVMVPRSVLSMPGDVQEAIAVHELLHVRRRDWLNVLFEELVRTIFWFHPAIWWLIERIQLTREHVVDDGVIQLTQSRDRYVEALLAVATSRTPPALVPASLFLRRRFLKRRLAHILQETTMTTRRLIASVTAGAGALALVVALAVRAFPLEAQVPQQEPHASSVASGPVQIMAGGEHLLHGALPEYPRRAIQRRVDGVVVLEVTVDDGGEVSDARVMSGPEELRRAALEAVLGWHYSVDAVRSSAVQVALRFTVHPEGAEGGELRAEAESVEPWSAQRAESQMLELEKAWADATASESQKLEYKQKYVEAKERLEGIRAREAAGAGASAVEKASRLVQIRTERVPQDVAKEIKDRAGIAIGDSITEATARRIRQVASEVDEHLRVSFTTDGRGGIVMTIIAP
jgi:TonB family protein